MRSGNSQTVSPSPSHEGGSGMMARRSKEEKDCKGQNVLQL